jgi:glutamyl-Q tRNA(Asp) synthetase
VFVTRFAPSPTGPLHLGHAYSALRVHDLAQAHGGVMLLRHEDIDASRVREPYYRAIEEDLAWLGLSWPHPPRRQTRHLADYRSTLDRLIVLGVVYRCPRTRKELAQAAGGAPQAGDLPDTLAHAPLPRLPEAEVERRIAAGEDFAWRFDPDAAVRMLSGARPRFHDHDAGDIEADPFRLGHAILARKDAPASYHLCVVHDDAAQGITDVIRGEDLAPAAHLHVTLQALLGLSTPRYRHHRLLMGADGKRLSKRDGAAALSAWRAAGWTPDDVRREVGL